MKETCRYYVMRIGYALLASSFVLITSYKCCEWLTKTFIGVDAFIPGETSYAELVTRWSRFSQYMNVTAQSYVSCIENVTSSCDLQQRTSASQEYARCQTSAQTNVQVLASMNTQSQTCLRAVDLLMQGLLTAQATLPANTYLDTAPGKNYVLSGDPNSQCTWLKNALRTQATGTAARQALAISQNYQTQSNLNLNTLATSIQARNAYDVSFVLAKQAGWTSQPSFPPIPTNLSDILLQADLFGTFTTAGLFASSNPTSPVSQYTTQRDYVNATYQNVKSNLNVYTSVTIPSFATYVNQHVFYPLTNSPTLSFQVDLALESQCPLTVQTTCTLESHGWYSGMNTSNLAFGPFASSFPETYTPSQMQAIFYTQTASYRQALNQAIVNANGNYSLLLSAYQSLLNTTLVNLTQTGWLHPVTYASVNLTSLISSLINGSSSSSSSNPSSNPTILLPSGISMNVNPESVNYAFPTFTLSEFFIPNVYNHFLGYLHEIANIPYYLSMLDLTFRIFYFIYLFFHYWGMTYIRKVIVDMRPDFSRSVSILSILLSRMYHRCFPKRKSPSQVVNEDGEDLSPPEQLVQLISGKDVQPVQQDPFTIYVLGPLGLITNPFVFALVVIYVLVTVFTIPLTEAYVSGLVVFRQGCVENRIHCNAITTSVVGLSSSSSIVNYTNPLSVQTNFTETVSPVIGEGTFLVRNLQSVATYLTTQPGSSLYSYRASQLNRWKTSTCASNVQTTQSIQAYQAANWSTLVQNYASVLFQADAIQSCLNEVNLVQDFPSTLGPLFDPFASGDICPDMETFSTPLENVIFDCSAITCELSSSSSSSNACLPPQPAKLDVPSWTMGCSIEAYIHSNVIWGFMTLFLYFLLNFMRMIGVPILIRTLLSCSASFIRHYTRIIWTSATSEASWIFPKEAQAKRFILNETDVPTTVRNVTLIDVETSFDENGQRYSTNGFVPFSSSSSSSENNNYVNGYVFDKLALLYRDMKVQENICQKVFLSFVMISFLYPIGIGFSQITDGIGTGYVNAYVHMNQSCPKQVLEFYTLIYS